MGASKQYQLRSQNKYIQLCEPQPQGLTNNAGLEVQLKAIQSSSYDLEAGLQTKWRHSRQTREKSDTL